MKVKRMGSKIHAKTQTTTQTAQTTTQTDRRIVESSKKYFYEWLKRYPDGPYDYEFHVPQVVRWAKFILKSHPNIDSEIVLASAWLHDIGSYPLSKKDHAVVGERVAKRFFKTQGYNPEKTKKILHCIRAHRCRDVMPETIEAKLVACADSASHFTDYIYIKILASTQAESAGFTESKGSRDSKKSSNYALEKLERDYKDLSPFPEVQKKLTPLYLKWKELFKEYNKVNSDISI